jgi:hypothetical protein
LTEKEKRLVKSALAIDPNSQGAVHSHTRRVRSEGIPEDAIQQTALLAVGPLWLTRAVAANIWIEDEKP